VLSLPADAIFLTVLFLMAWGVRVGLAGLGGLDRIEEGDAQVYYSEAVRMVEGKGLVRNLPSGIPHLSALNMPLTPLLLACGMKVFGTAPTVARVVAITIGSVSAPLTYLIAGTIMPRRWALLAGLACAIHPNFLFYSILTMTEPFYIPLLLLAVLLAIRAVRCAGFANAFAAGVAWGLAALCRPHAVPALILIAFGIGLTVRSWRPVLGLILGSVLVLMPWWARNYAVFARPVLLSLEGGETFLGANNPYVVENPELAGMWIAPMSIPEYRARMIQSVDELEINSTLMQIGIGYLRAHPEVIPGLVLKKWARWLTPITKSGGMIRAVVLVSYGGLLALVITGVAFGAVRNAPLLLPTLAITLADLAIVAVYWGNLTRGRIDLELIWLPWGVQTFRLLVAAPIAGWFRSSSPAAVSQLGGPT
jgi:hypothetical protein